MKRIAIYGNRHQDGHIENLQHFFDLLSIRGFYVWVVEHFANYLKDEGILFASDVQVVKDFPEESQCVISIGGDGTFLKAAQWTGHREKPILGINTGHLGYLASYSLDEMDELANVIERDLGQEERRALLEVKSEAIPSGFWPYALNEVAIQKAETSSMVTVHAEIDGNFLADYVADGLVIATPTGSTAYNLSVGGPIIQPTLGCFVLSPIAPHSLTMCPLVVSGSSELRLTTKSRSDHSLVSLDGRSFMIRCGEDEITLTRAPFSIIVLRRPNASFPRLLRSKLMWGKRE